MFTSGDATERASLHARGEELVAAKCSRGKKRGTACANRLNARCRVMIHPIARSHYSDAYENRVTENGAISMGSGSPRSVAAMQSPVRGVISTPFRECPVAYSKRGSSGSAPSMG